MHEQRTLYGSDRPADRPCELCGGSLPENPHRNRRFCIRCNQAKVLANGRKWRAQNPERNRENIRRSITAWRARNPEAVKEQRPHERRLRLMPSQPITNVRIVSGGTGYDTQVFVNGDSMPLQGLRAVEWHCNADEDGMIATAVIHQEVAGFSYTGRGVIKQHQYPGHCNGHGNYARGVAVIPATGSFATGYRSCHK